MLRPRAQQSRPPGATRSRKEPRRMRAPSRRNPPQRLSLDFWPPEGGDKKCLFFGPPSWSFVMTALWGADRPHPHPRVHRGLHVPHLREAPLSSGDLDTEEVTTIPGEQACSDPHMPTGIAGASDPWPTASGSLFLGSAYSPGLALSRRSIQVHSSCSVSPPTTPHTECPCPARKELCISWEWEASAVAVNRR